MSALREVTTKSEVALERETAKKWAERALACRKQYEKTGQIKWLLRAENYAHESIEHGALGGMDLEALRRSMEIVKKRGRRG